MSKYKLQSDEGGIVVQIENDRWTVGARGVIWIRGLVPDVYERGRRLPLRLERVGSPSERELRAIYHDERGPCVALRVSFASVRQPREVSVLQLELEALRDLDETAVEDSFLHTTFRTVLHLPAKYEFLSYTWGLRDPDDPYPGGDWPRAIWGRSLRELTGEEPFAPLLLYDPEAQRSCVIAPTSYELISPLHVHHAEQASSEPSGTVAVARGLHGAIRRIPKGTRAETWLAFGEEPIETLYAWGRALLARYGKARPDPLADPVLRFLGFWNAYGGYYAELFEGLDEGKLRALARHFDEVGIPVRYFGLDLWYEHDTPGLARSFRPDPKRFPRGLELLKRETGRTFFLHLSAFARENVYRERYPFYAEEHEPSAYPLTQTFYDDLGKELLREGANGVWHDWLRSQQFFVKRLRAELGAADEWFAHVCRGFSSQGLPLMLCMPTVGFLLASARHPNVILSRSFNDYLMKQREQLKKLNWDGAFTPPQEYLRQDLLVGVLLDALGLYPFYDLFISSAAHPEGFADPQAEQEAWRRALSAGPVGFGDKLGCEDAGLLRKLVLPDGTLCKPGCPPRPLYRSLFSDVLIAQSETALDGHRWVYVQALNVGEKPQRYKIDPARAVGDDVVIYDPLAGQTIEAIEGELPPAEGRYWLLAPLHDGVAFLGLIEQFVPVPTGVVTDAQAIEGGWQIELRLVPNHRYRLGAWGKGAVELSVKGGHIKADFSLQSSLFLWEVAVERESVIVRVVRE
jgi:hypothetical protein